jgi:hypothetical protein
MTQRRYHRDPVIWIIFAVAVSVPSIELTRLLRERDVSRAGANEPPRVEVAGQPRVTSPAPAAPLAPVTPSAPTAPKAPPQPEPQEPVYIGPVEEQDAALMEPPQPPPLVDAAPAGTLDSSRFLPIGVTATPIMTSAILPNGNVAAVLEASGAVTVWDISMHKQLARFNSGIVLQNVARPITPHMALVRPREAAEAQTLLAIGTSDGGFRVWNALTGKRMLATTHPVMDVAWTGITELTTLGADGTIRVWDVTQPLEFALISTPSSPGGKVRDIDFNEENEAFTVASLSGVHILRRFDREGWVAVDSVRGPYPRSVVTSPNGRYLAIGWSSDFITVYHTPVIRPVKKDGTVERGRIVPRMSSGFSSHGSPPPLLVFNPDGTLLAVSHGGRRIFLHSQLAGPSPPAVHVPRGDVRSMWFTPDGRSLIVGVEGEHYLRKLTVPPAPQMVPSKP